MIVAAGVKDPECTKRDDLILQHLIYTNASFPPPRR